MSVSGPLASVRSSGTRLAGSDASEQQQAFGRQYAQYLAANRLAAAEIATMPGSEQQRAFGRQYAEYLAANRPAAAEAAAKAAIIVGSGGLRRRGTATVSHRPVTRSSHRPSVAAVSRSSRTAGRRGAQSGERELERSHERSRERSQRVLRPLGSVLPPGRPGSIVAPVPEPRSLGRPSRSVRAKSRSAPSRSRLPRVPMPSLRNPASARAGGLPSITVGASKESRVDKEKAEEEPDKEEEEEAPFRVTTTDEMEHKALEAKGSSNALRRWGSQRAMDEQLQLVQNSVAAYVRGYRNPGSKQPKPTFLAGTCRLGSEAYAKIAKWLAVKVKVQDESRDLCSQVQGLLDAAAGLPKVQVTGYLGGGKNGIALRVTVLASGQEAALKLTKPEGAETECEVQQSFASHGLAPAVYACGSEEVRVGKRNVMWLLMERVDTTLEDWLADHHADQQLVSVAQGIWHYLTSLEAQHLTHGDLHLTNLVLTRDLETKTHARVSAKGPTHLLTGEQKTGTYGRVTAIDLGYAKTDHSFFVLDWATVFEQLMWTFTVVGDVEYIEGQKKDTKSDEVFPLRLPKDDPEVLVDNGVPGESGTVERLYTVLRHRHQQLIHTVRRGTWRIGQLLLHYFVLRFPRTFQVWFADRQGYEPYPRLLAEATMARISWWRKRADFLHSMMYSYYRKDKFPDLESKTLRTLRAMYTRYTKQHV